MSMSFSKAIKMKDWQSKKDDASGKSVSDNFKVEDYEVTVFSPTEEEEELLEFANLSFLTGSIDKKVQISNNDAEAWNILELSTSKADETAKEIDGNENQYEEKFPTK